MFDTTRIARSVFLKALLCALLLTHALHAPAVAAGAMPSARERELAAIIERSYFAPRDALRKLAAVQASGGAMSVDEQALLLRASGSALFRRGDQAGAIAHARRLQQLGRRHGNRDHECLGILQEVYARFVLGQIQAAHQLTRQARSIPQATLSADTRVRTLLTLAQSEDEQRRGAAADAALAEALEAAAGDRQLLFLATRQQAARAIAAGKLAVAKDSVERLLALAERSPYPEQRVRAGYMEYQYAAAAGLTARADGALEAVIRRMRALDLDESLGWALLEYADFKLKRKHFDAAAALSSQALQLESVRAAPEMARVARFNHAVARIRSGAVAAGKREIEALFAAIDDPGVLVELVPEYMEALAHSGDVDGAVRAGALYAQVQSDDTLRRATEEDRAQRRIEQLDQERRLRALEAERERARRGIWQAAFASALVGAAAILLLYRRLRANAGLLAAANEQLSFANKRDFLTGLFNRRYIEGIASGPQADGTGLALLLDIDHFKHINDSRGHAAGDEVLKQVAQRLAARVGTEGVVARWGGEEFLALLPGADASRMQALAADLLHAVAARPVALGDEEIRVTVSLGACPLGLVPRGATRWEQVLRMADEALYLSKARGRNRACAATGAATACIELAHGPAAFELRNEAHMAQAAQAAVQ